MSSSLRASKLLEICTPSISYDSQVQSACYSFDQQMYEIIDETGRVIMIPNIMGLTDPALVDILAWQFSVEGYDTSLDLEFRKGLVQKSIEWHRRKGTVDLIREVIDTYWPGGASLQEWFEYKDLPLPNYPDPGWHDRYRFRIAIDQGVITPAEEVEVTELVNRYKPVSRWLEDIVYQRVSTCGIGFAGMTLKFVYRTSEKPKNYP